MQRSKELRGCGLHLSGAIGIALEMNSSSNGTTADPSSIGAHGGAVDTTTSSDGLAAGTKRISGEALNASHIERRRLKKKYTVKKLEKKLENYSRQIKK